MKNSKKGKGWDRGRVADFYFDWKGWVTIITGKKKRRVTNFS